MTDINPGLSLKDQAQAVDQLSYLDDVNKPSFGNLDDFDRLCDSIGLLSKMPENMRQLSILTTALTAFLKGIHITAETACENIKSYP